ncbi:hypothetical protein [Brevibacterium otitidis]|uniref:Uncharacterized protein n=1 Tax=Brevibacterium otitidis TaxID=53364 RepID=A0ABV5X530_9MICO
MKALIARLCFRRTPLCCGSLPCFIDAWLRLGLGFANTKAMSRFSG